MNRAGNNPKRRIAVQDLLDEIQRARLVTVSTYVASGHHKRNPGDYGLERTNPRPTKSLCDAVRILKMAEAKMLLANGILHGMVSPHTPGEFPKFVWSVDGNGTVYEAKTDGNARGAYHGYPLEAEDDFRAYVLSEWKKRCRLVGK
ncbi:MAG: hypothetical protein E5W91_25110 [Mesorhizobium sp.]|uniref:hypothetical protein n=1 Tax=Mesorhizobium sp. TaxID=1871066 RepID=UPI00120818DF|nr:hypothetical protein [Mesorhizobium sp.]TIS54883.1 MAG: hypothetical protein E5W91_25110 [Mesorhizobium sp.]